MLESPLDSQLPAGNDAIEARKAREEEYELQAAKEQAEQVRRRTANGKCTTSSLMSMNANLRFCIHFLYTNFA